jgi:FKBP-type peptidyl-prolyl cis-trans isomerase SlyD
MALLVGDHAVVSMHYKLTDDDGNVLDDSKGSDPLTYLHGAGNIIPGLETALAGKSQGDSLQVRVKAADAYGEIDPQLIQNIDKSAFEGVETIEVGMAFEAQAPDGSQQRIQVKAVEENTVTIDANHPLAGMALNFDVEIVAIRAATEEEISHGHVH